MVMSRDVDAATLAELSSGREIYPVLAVHLDWPGAPVWVHSSVGVISWGGHSWLGLGRFGGIETPEEAGGLASWPLTLTLVGPPDEMDAYLDDPIRNRAASVRWGLLTRRGGNVLVGALNAFFDGYMDAMRDSLTLADGGVERMIRLQAVSGPSARASAQVFHTAENQAAAYPGDTAGELVQNAEAEATAMRWPE